MPHNIRRLCKYTMHQSQTINILFLAALIVYRNTVLLCLCRQVVRDPHLGDTNVKRADGCFYELKTACYRQSNGYGLATNE